MLKIQKSDSERCGGILSALSDNSAEYLWDQISRHTCHKQQLDSPPGRTVLHKDPHLDDYLGELLFRAAMPSDSRPLDFLEMAIYAENDSNARMFWKESAVFGMGFRTAVCRVCKTPLRRTYSHGRQNSRVLRPLSSGAMLYQTTCHSTLHIIRSWKDRQSGRRPSFASQQSVENRSPSAFHFT